MNKERKKFGFNIAQKAGVKLLENFRENDPHKRGTSKEVKSTLDEVTDAIITEGIEENFPNDSYLTEESGLVQKDNDYIWIVDPLDGTGNFENHNPFFAVSIALWRDHIPVWAVVEAPGLQERFYATEQGAFRKDLKTDQKEELHISDKENIYESYFIFCEGKEKSSRRIAKNFKEIYNKTTDFRKLASAALELCWVASGRAEGYLTYKIPLWDIAAGLFILKKAGGDIYNFKKETLTWKDLQVDQTVDLLALNGKVPLDFTLD